MLHGKIHKVLNGQGGNYIFPFFWKHGEEEAVFRDYMRVINESTLDIQTVPTFRFNLTGALVDGENELSIE